MMVLESSENLPASNHMDVSMDVSTYGSFLGCAVLKCSWKNVFGDVFFFPEMFPFTHCFLRIYIYIYTMVSHY